MTNEAEKELNKRVHRAPRYSSHALVEVRKYKYLPFGVQSAVLLDISQMGFKLEFTGEVEAKEGERYWLHIPLSPLGITAPIKFSARTIVKWCDNGRCRIGGEFINLSNTDRLTVEKIINSLEAQKANR